jgi:hypothetical protein
VCRCCSTAAAAADGCGGAHSSPAATTLQRRLYSVPACVPVHRASCIVCLCLGVYRRSVRVCARVQPIAGQPSLTGVSWSLSCICVCLYRVYFYVYIVYRAWSMSFLVYMYDMVQLVSCSASIYVISSSPSHVPRLHRIRVLHRASTAAHSPHCPVHRVYTCTRARRVHLIYTSCTFTRVRVPWLHALVHCRRCRATAP